METLSTDELGQLLFSPDESTREEALRWIKLRHDEKVLMQVSSALENTAPGSFFYSLVEVLGTLADTRALPTLTGAYHRVRQDLPRLALLRSIGKIKGRQSETFLLSVLDTKPSWPLQIAALDELLAYPNPVVLPRLLEVFVASPLPEKVAVVVEKAARERPEWSVAEAFALRLLLAEGLSEGHCRAAIKFLKSFGNASSIPLIESWVDTMPSLRQLASVAVRHLKGL